MGEAIIVRTGAKGKEGKYGWMKCSAIAPTETASSSNMYLWHNSDTAESNPNNLFCGTSYLIDALGRFSIVDPVVYSVVDKSTNIDLTDLYFIYAPENISEKMYYGSSKLGYSWSKYRAYYSKWYDRVTKTIESCLVADNADAYPWGQAPDGYYYAFAFRG